VAREHDCQAAIAGLASELELVRATVSRLEGLSTDVSQLSRLVRELANQVDALTRRSVPVAATSWIALPDDLDAAVGILGELVDWLGAVFLRYPDAEAALPECWLWHPGVIEELLWLMYAWRAAYTADGGTVALAGDWHDRYRPGVTRRIKRTADACSLDRHCASGDRSHGSPARVPLADALEPIARWWADGRGEAPPTPTDAQLNAARELSWSGGGRR
jgi:hypothetical protein